MGSIIYFSGGETGGTEELVSVGTGWSVNNSAKYGGVYSYVVQGTQSNTITYSTFYQDTARQEGIYSLSFNLRFNTPTLNRSDIIFDCGGIFLSANTLDGTNFVLSCQDDSEAGWFAGTTNLAASTWHHIEMIWEAANGTAGWAKVYVNGQLYASGTGRDTLDATNGLTVRGATWRPAGFNALHWIDDVVICEARDENDLLGNTGIEVLAFQNTAGATATPDLALVGTGVLDSGFWSNIAQTPINNAFAEYTNTPLSGLCDLEGPSSFLISGGTIRAATWRASCARGNGGGTSHYIYTGASDATYLGDTSRFTVELNTSQAFFTGQISLLGSGVDGTNAIASGGSAIIRDVAYSADLDLLLAAVLNNGSIEMWYSSDGGNSWSQATGASGSYNTPYIVVGKYNGNDRILVYRDTTTPLFYSSNGTSYSGSSNLTNGAYQICYDEVNDVFIAATPNGPYYSATGGSIYTAATSHPFGTDTPVAVAAGNGVAVMVTSGGSQEVAYSTDGGDTWTLSTTQPTLAWNRVWYFEGTDTFVIGTTGYLYYSKDGGDTWTAITDDPYYATGNSYSRKHFYIPAIGKTIIGKTTLSPSQFWSEDGVKWYEDLRPSTGGVYDTNASCYDSTNNKFIGRATSNLKVHVVDVLSDPTTFDFAHGFGLDGARDFINYEMWTMALFVPTGTTSQNLSATYLSPNTTLWTPSVSPGSVSRTADYISASTTLYDPVVHIVTTRAIDYIAPTTTLYEPTVAPGTYTLSLDYISPVTALYDPTWTATYTATLDYIASTTTLYDPSWTASYTIQLDYISPTTTLYEPTWTASYTISLDYISATTTLYDPSVDITGAPQNVDPGYIVATTTLYDPTLAASYTIALGYISPATALYDPTLAASYTAGLNYIAPTTTLYDPTLAASYTVSVGYIAPSTTLYEPSLAASYTIALDYISPATTLYEPTWTASYDLALNYIAPNTTLYDPNVSSGATYVDPGYISPTTALYEPTWTASYDLALNYIAASTTLYDPSLQASYTVALDYIGSSTTLYQPTFTTSVTLALDYIAPATTLYEATPYSSYTLSLNYIAPGTTLYEPTVIFDQFIDLGFISATTSVFDPTLTSAGITVCNYIAPSTTLYEPVLAASYDIALGYIAASTTLYEPTLDVSYTVALGYIGSSTTLYEPTTSLTFTLGVNYIAPSTTLYEPTLDASYAIALDYLSPGTAVYDPVLTSSGITVLDYIAASTALYDPTLDASYTVTLGYISPSVSLFEPSLASSYTIALDYISPATTLYDPVLTSSGVTAIDYIAPGTTLYEPAFALSYDIALDYITAATATYDPTLVAGAETIPLGYISPTTTLFDPALTSSGITVVDYIAPTTTLFDPVLFYDQAIALGYIAASTTLHEPDLASSYDLALNFISSNTTTYEPTISEGEYRLPVDYLTPVTALYEPELQPGSVSRELSYIAASTALYEPAVDVYTNVGLDYIAPTTTLYEPSMETGAITISLGYIAPATALYDINVEYATQTVDLDFITSSTALYELTVVNGILIDVDVITDDLTLYENIISFSYDRLFEVTGECLRLEEQTVQLTSFKVIAPLTEELTLGEAEVGVALYNRLHTIQFSSTVFYEDPIAGVSFKKVGANPTEIITPTGVLEASGTSSTLSYTVEWANPVEAGDEIIFIYDGKAGTYSNGRVDLRSQNFAISLCA